MPYVIRHDPSSDIVEVIYIGLITGADLRTSTSECVAFQRRTGAIRFLVELSGGELEASTLEIYDLPDEQYPTERVDVRTRIAVILPSPGRAREAALFYEAACRNRGWQARSLPDRESAVGWLRAP